MWRWHGPVISRAVKSWHGGLRFYLGTQALFKHTVLFNPTALYIHPYKLWLHGMRSLAMACGAGVPEWVIKPLPGWATFAVQNGS